MRILINKNIETIKAIQYLSTDYSAKKIFEFCLKNKIEFKYEIDKIKIMTSERGSKIIDKNDWIIVHTNSDVLIRNDLFVQQHYKVMKNN